MATEQKKSRVISTTGIGWNQEINNNNVDDDNNNDDDNYNDNNDNHNNNNNNDDDDNDNDNDNGILHENDREHPKLAAKVTCCFGSHFCSHFLSIPMRSQRLLLNLESTSDLDIRPTDLHAHTYLTPAFCHTFSGKKTLPGTFAREDCHFTGYCIDFYSLDQLYFSHHHY